MLERVLSELRVLIETERDILSINTPVGLTIPVSGEKYYLQWSLTETPTVFESIGDLSIFLDNYLNEQKPLS